MNIDIKSLIGKEYNFKRKKPPVLHNVEDGVKAFKAIGDEILRNKSKTFDLKDINTIKKLIDWLFMMGLSELSYDKGIILKGDTGRGKTFLFKVFRYLAMTDDMMNIKIVNVKQIAGEYSDPHNGGYDVIEKYSKMIYLMIDDIGKEPQKSISYGNKVNVVEEIINNREEKGLITFATTNLQSMGEFYDSRTVSRMNAMFNVIAINHNIDYRKA